MNHKIQKVHLSRSFLLILVLGACLLFVVPTPVVHAAIITLTDPSGGTGGPGCKLRDAITAANTDTPAGGCPAGNGDDTIVIPAGYIVTLTDVDNGSGTDTNGLPVIDSNITINGNGAIIQRSSSPGTPNFRIFYVNGGINLTLNNVIIQNGRAGDGGGSGGGILNAGTLVVNYSTVSGNRTGDGTYGGSGGGIMNGGTLTITHSHTDGNTTGNGSTGVGGQGGGIFNNGTLNISDSTVDSNATGTGTSGGSGGGIFNYYNRAISLANTSVSSNSIGAGTGSGSDGGGIYNASNATASVTSCVIRGNTAGNGGTSGGYGGGIYQGNGSMLTIANSTISGNTAGNGSTGGGSGGGIHQAPGGTLTLTNSTVSGNSTGAPNGDGGGISSNESITVTSSTIANNTATRVGGGISFYHGTVTVKNTIVANNTASGAPNCFHDPNVNAVNNGGNNLDSGTSCGWGSTNGSMSSTDPLLGALGNYGGSRQTMPLLPNSPAIDGVAWSAPNGSPTTDERGVARPQGVRHDIGAYEVVVITVNDTSGTTGSPGCKLRDAVTAANTDTATGGCPTGLGPDIIVLPTGATITLLEVDNQSAFSTNGLPVISSTVTINGNNATIQRSSTDGTPAFRIFEVNADGNLTLNNVTLRNGRASDGPFGTWPGQSGGAVSSSGTLVVNNSTISGNRAGSSVSGPGGDGGGINASGPLTVTNSTISGNTTGSGTPDGDGGGIYASDGLTMTNSTLTANTAYGEGGGLVADGGGGVTSSTIANNTAASQGGGVRAEVPLRNTIVANNSAPIGANCYGPTPNGGNNLDSGTSCGWGTTNGSLSSTNPLLGALGYYGGPTQTLPLASTSPARDAVTWSPPNGSPSTDQRGFGRPYGVRHDIGAFEWHPPVYLPLLRK